MSADKHFIQSAYAARQSAKTCTKQRRRFPPGSWVQTRPLLRPTESIPLVGPAKFWEGVGEWRCPYTAVDTPEYWTRVLCLTLAYLYMCKHICHFTMTEKVETSPRLFRYHPDPCEMFMIYQYSKSGAGRVLSTVYAINRCGSTDLNCMQFLIYKRCKPIARDIETIAR